MERCMIHALLFLFVCIIYSAQTAKGQDVPLSDVSKADENSLNALFTEMPISILYCYPNIIMPRVRVPYRCGVDNVSALGSDPLYFAMQETLESFNPLVWSLSRVNGTSEVEFTPLNDEWASRRNFYSFVIVKQSHLASAYTVMTASIYLQLIQQEETFAYFLSPGFYGLPPRFYSFVPDAERYLLIAPNTDCHIASRNCHPSNGCFDMTDAFLPPPASYTLCLTRSQWNGVYLPCGTSTLNVLPILNPWGHVVAGDSTTLPLFTSGMNSITIGGAFLRRCPNETCPMVRLRSGETAVQAEFCKSVPEEEQLQVRWVGFNKVIDAPIGTYALCVGAITGEVNTSAMFPVHVVREPFHLRITRGPRQRVKLHISGGDISYRQTPYSVCIMDDGVSQCYSRFVPPLLDCTPSPTPNTNSITMDYKKHVFSPNVVFCLYSWESKIRGELWKNLGASNGILDYPYPLIGNGVYSIGFIILIAMIPYVILTVGCVVAIAGTRNSRLQRFGRRAPPPAPPTDWTRVRSTHTDTTRRGVPSQQLLILRQ